MNLKKMVSNTMDMMTLSYIERHLKEAYDQEYAIPTTVLSIIAEKSYNEHNLKSIGMFIEKSLKVDSKEWRKYRNLMKIIEYILKFACPDATNVIRRFQNEIRMLQSYNYVEAGNDRGASVREGATAVINLLNNPRELDYVRDQCKKDKEKYTGISSDLSQNYNRYNSYDSGYKGFGSDNLSSNYSNDYKTPSYNNDDRGFYKNSMYNESNTKFAESVFGGYREENKGPSGQYTQPSFRQEIPSGGITTNDFSSGRREIGFRRETPSSVPDIFSMGQSRKPQETNLFDLPQKENPVDLFSNVVTKDNKPQNTNLLDGQSLNLLDTNHEPGVVTNQIPNDIFSYESKPKSSFGLSDRSQDLFLQGQNEKPKDLFSINPGQSKAPDLFGVPFKDKNPIPQKIDLFSGSVPQSHGNIDLFSSSSKVEDSKGFILGNEPRNNLNDIDLFSQTHVKTSEPVFSGGLAGQSQNKSLFSGMTQKKTQGFPDEYKPQMLQESFGGSGLNFDLGSLNLNITSGTTRANVQNIPSVQNVISMGKSQENKGRIDLIKNEPAPAPQVKKNLTAEQLEAKLLGLEF
ncbi:hypothetical protein SteCoe_9047 [Stentor coeruleus]|uniref:ENTH domain-containing protein n=1 Tax=Stentor coeruleus TaxID=5963 RepID=A0A1R2CIV5_9CILI|nr:hypothetical protein SteCoe_9047 [Stentor coeruleus]